jgi:hypothetical protein
LTIQFPVIRSLIVENYGLFENARSRGIRHEFGQGVHVIVGINGLGKTTLLNILYRSLVGPRDMNKDDGGLSSSQHLLVDWRNKKFFRARVRDEAREASVSMDVSFGRHILSVRRSLRTMEVEALSLDGTPEDATQDRYEEITCELSNAASFFDFFAMLRFLIFFLEDRPELIWDQRSQFDMLRLLFYDRPAARDAAEAYDRVQTLDSQFRNRRVPVNDARAKLEAYEAAERSGLASEIRVTRAALAAARDQDQEFVDQINERRREREGAQLRREKALLDLEEARRAYEREQQLFYAHVFPDLGETAEHVFLNLLGGGGCLVCGNKATDAAVRLTECIARHQCPICESMPDQQEKVVSNAEFNQKRLDRLSSQVEKLREGVSEQEQLLDDAENGLRNLVDARQASFDQVSQLEVRMAQLQRQVTPDVADIAMSPESREIEYLREYVRKGDAELQTLRANRIQAETRYKEIKDSQESALDARIQAVKASFGRIARNLLAETCQLRQAEITRKIGQEGDLISFPTFEVMMSSGIFTGSLSPREDSSAVSESQREFIDLAFRMALMEIAAGADGDAMLVLETPEASLDSLFVTEAGALFRRFASGGGALGNVFVASTNLNNEDMIPSLLGITQPPLQEERQEDTDILALDIVRAPEPAVGPVPVRDRHKYLINLLDLAAPNAALRRHGVYYARKLSDAVFQDVAAGDRPLLASLAGDAAISREGNREDNGEPSG